MKQEKLFFQKRYNSDFIKLYFNFTLPLFYLPLIFTFSSFIVRLLFVFRSSFVRCRATVDPL
ncbi:hypothetical protein HMPREF1977_0313 [Capnocytophaga ochracea F0287]|uniref:Uncharacterized protein n=1 Tax=Capnocytophaga ochracea F0287 TaxID=873517 RepID=E4MPK1_CAPOC|nr:hypothetical protein HMPREF1977_0313 [Capnocytophaga ochracea F0287]EJF43159.1 hypothetical protein HMPREF1319_2087 [Capnocytophaga ochracea str. Holt 25]